jgi:hypothetical protein
MAGVSAHEVEALHWLSEGSELQKDWQMGVEDVDGAGVTDADRVGAAEVDGVDEGSALVDGVDEGSALVDGVVLGQGDLAGLTDGVGVGRGQS